MDGQGLNKAAEWTLSNPVAALLAGFHSPLLRSRGEWHALPAHQPLRPRLLPPLCLKFEFKFEFKNSVRLTATPESSVAVTIASLSGA